ncbi:hypothetical protein AB0I77_26340 [Streptomyces sp. NPDC050619]|uniref:hypothetical protein n=1 Tax=Streptomyces sp. NPDC050619 TaxID=3157214 RepID=UPI00343E520C
MVKIPKSASPRADEGRVYLCGDLELGASGVSDRGEIRRLILTREIPSGSCP